MASYVLKIKFGDVLRRVTVEPSLLGNGPDMTFSQLEETIRQTFKIPATSDFVITYTDKENDVVTMAGDQDLHDALIFQGLNPLRLTVTEVVAREPHRGGRHGDRGSWRHGHEHGHGHRHGHEHGHGPRGHGHGHGPHHNAHPEQQPSGSIQPDLSEIRKIVGNTLKMSQDTAKQTVDYAQQLLQAVEPLIKGAPSMVVNEVKEAIMKLAAPAAAASASTQPGTEQAANTFEAVPLQPLTFPFTSVPPPPGFSPVCHFPTTSNVWGPPEICFTNANEANPAASQDVKEPVQHRGVQCDVCGMVPIIGNRYKSTKKHDYDLCQKCFENNGSIEEYTKIERPLWRPRHFSSQFSGGRLKCPAMSSYYGGRHSFHGMRGAHHGHGPQHGGHGGHGPHGFHGPYGGKSEGRCGGAAGGKLDARFVQDVTIFDGTEFAPGCPFTKIWRLRNSGTCAWPRATQLVHVGGDELGATTAFNIELPEDGLNPDSEAEVSVDLVAPEKPGRYVSHWRLASPSGQKFGHRVWVLIQVVPSDEQSPQMMQSLLSSSQEDIEMPEEEAEEETLLVNVPQAMEEEQKEVADPFVPVESVTEVAAGAQYPEINMEALSLDAVVVDDAKTQQQEENIAVENSELGNFSMVNMPIVTEIPSEETSAPPAAVIVDEPEPAAPESDKEEMRKAAQADSVDVILGTLESMGFKQRDLNLELLTKNEFDVQRTVDDLVMAAEWDPMLEELEEMGFYDTDMNRRLMFKNNGSVKRVVKELVQMYKDPKGKEQI